jgi:uncharacterized protein YjbI with pentapeptide repeats
MKTVFRNQKFSGAETHERSFEDAIVIDCTFVDYVLEGANFMDAVFVNCKFRKADFYWANTFRSQFVGCTLEDIDFRGANMDETIFLECTLTRCDFQRDNLGAFTDVGGIEFINSTQENCLYEYPEARK